MDDGSLSDELVTTWLYTSVKHIAFRSVRWKHVMSLATGCLRISKLNRLNGRRTKMLVTQAHHNGDG